MMIDSPLEDNDAGIDLSGISGCNRECLRADSLDPYMYDKKSSTERAFDFPFLSEFFNSDDKALAIVARASLSTSVSTPVSTPDSTPNPTPNPTPKSPDLRFFTTLCTNSSSSVSSTSSSASSSASSSIADLLLL